MTTTQNGAPRGAGARGTEAPISIREIVEKMNDKYEELSQKQEKMKAVKEVARKIALELNTVYNNEVAWHATKGVAEAKVVMSSEVEDKIKEMWEYIYPEYVVYNTYVLVTSKKVEEYKKVRNDIREIGREIVGEIMYEEREDNAYENYIFAGSVNNVYVYIVVVDGRR